MESIVTISLHAISYTALPHLGSHSLLELIARWVRTVKFLIQRIVINLMLVTPLLPNHLLQKTKAYLPRVLVNLQHHQLPNVRRAKNGNMRSIKSTKRQLSFIVVKFEMLTIMYTRTRRRRSISVTSMIMAKLWIRISLASMGLSKRAICSDFNENLKLTWQKWRRFQISLP